MPMRLGGSLRELLRCASRRRRVSGDVKHTSRLAKHRVERHQIDQELAPGTRRRGDEHALAVTERVRRIRLVRIEVTNTQRALDISHDLGLGERSRSVARHGGVRFFRSRLQARDPAREVELGAFVAIGGFGFDVCLGRLLGLLRRPFAAVPPERVRDDSSANPKRSLQPSGKRCENRDDDNQRVNRNKRLHPSNEARLGAFHDVAAALPAGLEYATQSQRAVSQSLASWAAATPAARARLASTTQITCPQSKR